LTHALTQGLKTLLIAFFEEASMHETTAAAQARLEKLQQSYHELEARIRERTEELEQANAALQESEQRFRVALVNTPVVVFNQDLDLRYTWIYNPQHYAEQPIVGKTDAELFSPEDALRLTALKKRVIAAGLLTREEVSLTVGRRTSFYDMTLDPLYDENGAVTGLTCAATDITERKHIEEEVRRRLAESEGLQRIAKGLLQKVGLDEVLEIVCAEAMQLTGAKGSAVLLLDQDGWLKLTHRAGTPVYNLDRLPVEGSFAGRAVQTGSHVWVNRQDRELDEAADLWQGFPWTPGLLSMLSVPLKVDLQPIGVLNILNKPGDLTQEDIRIINLFADQAAIIIEHVRLQHQAERFAVLEERQRLARELHDSVTQALYSVTLYADAARLAFSRKQWEALERNLQEVRNMAREAMYDMRLLVFELRPFMLEKEGLASALRARLAAVEARAGLKTEVQVEGERRLPIGIEEELYRIAQEGLNNVVKHAKASVVKIHLKYEEDAVHLEMIDNGTGFDPNASRSGGVGLRGIQERVQKSGGRLKIDSSPGKGTRLAVKIPIGERDLNKPGARARR
jgi:signal transduction histidine kinase